MQSQMIKQSQTILAQSEGLFHDTSRFDREENGISITKIGIVQPRAINLQKLQTSATVHFLTSVQQVFCFTSVFITAFYPARGVARARGVTVVRHPQCSAKEEGRAKKSYEKSGNERTEKEGEIRRKTANHR